MEPEFEPSFWRRCWNAFSTFVARIYRIVARILDWLSQFVELIGPLLSL